MKILHALVGYLAVIALPFYPYAFASPLAAIDYDGYVDTRQNHKYVTPMKHAPGDIIEARQSPLVIPVTGLILFLVADVVLSIVWVAGDNSKREKFTINTINSVKSQYPSYNWVICHSPYSTGFDGVEGTDWGHTHHELGISFHRTIGYDLYWAKSGIFYRHGDGGSINWAYNGNVIRTDDDGATLHFGTTS